EGIKPCPDKTSAVLQLPSPQTIKEVQSLNRKLASLNRLFSKSVEKSLPLFQTLKKCIKKSDLRWTTEAEQAFQQLKKHLSALPMLAAPKPHEELIMYLSATHGAISEVLLTERGTIQTPVYFISLFNKPSTAELILNCQVPRSKNKKADALSKIASTSFAHLSKQVLVEVLETKSIAGKEVTAVIEEEDPTWMTELVNYLKEGTLPADEKEARKIRLKARQYEVIEGILYKRSFLTPWLRSLSRRAGESQIPDRRNGLLHEMDRSKSGGNDYRWTSEEICIGQYCMPLRYSKRNNLGQR
nr:reverse transcriptase domain-containing protein [Tanacetum cinerariifolium]